MAESIHEQLAAAVQASLAAIAGDAGATYWYTPGAVVRTLWFDEDGPNNVLDASISGPIYAVRPGDEQHEEKVTQSTDAEADLFILVAKVFRDSDSPFKPASPSRWTVINRMVRDVLRKLLQDPQLLSVGGAVDNIFVVPGIVYRDRWVDGWAIAEIHLRIGYRYLGGVP
jgi:hypothetical protein